MPSRRRSRITEWNGDQVVANLLTAAELGVNTVTTAAAAAAKSAAPRRHGRLRRYIGSRPAVRTEMGRQVIGLWGVLDPNRHAFYAWIVEKGGSRSPAQPFLGPSADANYRRLPAEIRRRLK